jgi:2,3-dihydroxybiphenyl 1,2-dioxygenase
MSSARVLQLGYLGFEVSDLAAWERFATSDLGLELAARREDGELLLRLDEHAYRLALTPGPADDLAFVGWQVQDASALDAIVGRLRAAGVTVEEGTSELAEKRCVERLAVLRDPAGNRLELFCGPDMARTQFGSPLVPSGFVAGDLGLGHLVVTANDRKEHERFYTELLGFRVSDHIVTKLGKFEIDLSFLHVNDRHHSLAFGGQQAKRIHHFMLEVNSVDDVGRAFDRMIRSRTPIANTMGRHPNDRMVSFYAKTPSGFQVEFGSGGVVVDDATWVPQTYDSVSEWGHLPPRALAAR